MNTNTVLFAVWALVTVVLVALLVYRSRLTRQESDWIDLTDDEDVVGKEVVGEGCEGGAGVVNGQA